MVQSSLHRGWRRARLVNIFGKAVLVGRLHVGFVGLDYVVVTTSCSITFVLACMPSLPLACRMETSLSIRPSRITVLTARLPMSTSAAATRPWPSYDRRSSWQTTPRNEFGQHRTTWGCCSVGKLSITRSIVRGTMPVCRVPKTTMGHRQPRSTPAPSFPVAQFADQHHVGILTCDGPVRG